MRRFTQSIIVVGSLLLLAACGGGGASSAPVASQPAASQPAASDAAGGTACAPAPAGAAATVEVEIKDFAYSPEPVSAAVGDVISWTNADSAPHTASLEDGSCGTESLNQGDSGALVFNEPGTYTYMCNVHPGQMKGFTIEVQ
jgi:plastocyanin